MRKWYEKWHYIMELSNRLCCHKNPGDWWRRREVDARSVHDACRKARFDARLAAPWHRVNK